MSRLNFSIDDSDFEDDADCWVLPAPEITMIASPSGIACAHDTRQIPAPIAPATLVPAPPPPPQMLPFTSRVMR